MASMGYPDSYYMATAVGIHDHPRLEESLRADVCVIGGGFTGLSAALNLAEQGMDVVLLEAERIGFGPSGRNGGLIGSGQRGDLLEMEQQFGFERSRLFWEFAEAAKTEIRYRVAKHDIDCDLQDGQVEGVHKKRYVGQAEKYATALAERYDYPHCRALSREETRAMIATDDFLEGLHDSQAMTIHPLNYALGLARVARDAGVRIFENTRVLKLFPQLDDVRIDYAWGGTLSVTVNRLPHVGRLEPNLFFAQGYSGHGISTAIFAGKVIAEAIAGTAGRFDVFASLPVHTFPGGTLLRYPGMVLGMLYYSIKDKL